MRIYAVVQGEYGQRIVDNIKEHGPESWDVLVWKAPQSLPIIVDDPEDFLPQDPPHVGLILSLVEGRSASELIPDIAKLAGAQAVIAPVDNRAWLPRGMMRQVEHRLAIESISSALPTPFCSLEVQPGQHPLIQEFATHFGRPKLEIEVENGRIARVHILREAPCGSTHLVAQRLRGIPIEKAEEEAGLAHHHYPCLASMGMDDEFEDTLMHRSGLMTKLAVHGPLRSALRGSIVYVRPP
jgi:hypothetical protein